MKVVVTGARGKVGSAAVRALQRAGHEVHATDMDRGVFERPLDGEVPYWQADLTDAGAAFAVLRGADAVVHAAALPDPLHNPPHVVFANNLLTTFNVVEAAVRWGLRRLVHLSSESVPGFMFAERPWLPAYVPFDEDIPVRPQDPYAQAKHFGEQLCDAAVRRSDLRCISLRPSWVQHDGNYERNLGPLLRDPSLPSANFYSYIDVDDLAEAIRLAVESELRGHEVMLIAAADNATGRPLAELVRAAHGDAVEVRPLPRADASGIDSGRARRLLGWEPTRSWRDNLDDQGRRR